MSNLKARIEALKNRGPVEIVTAPLLYPTPHDLAARMVDILDPDAGHRILEPSAGTGALLSALETCGLEYDVTAIEINYDLMKHLRLHFDCKLERADFLQIEPIPEFDRIIMNPPFNDGADYQHILHALKFLKPGGRLVAICSNGPRQNAKLKHLCESWEVLPVGTFKSAGTMVNTVLMVIQL